ncbi:hypothetical protein CYMTET_29485 [Cymbomonas tetramitiformis]|uniref:Uncharacterized protein n=1 Tax=Cymbomonas tetramitiformis TaxID=36881 RepID=A0AAE0FKZ5_9CHLO|nr:hypothetical protein CYMTET_29485 [Cymbomonas tetramitiformis]
MVDEVSAMIMRVNAINQGLNAVGVSVENITRGNASGGVRTKAGEIYTAEAMRVHSSANVRTTDEIIAAGDVDTLEDARIINVDNVHPIKHVNDIIGKFVTRQDYTKAQKNIYV